MVRSGFEGVSANDSGIGSAYAIQSQGGTVAPDPTPSDSAVILSTGKAMRGTSGLAKVNAAAGTRTVHKTSGDETLTEDSGQRTLDAVVGKETLVPEGNTLAMQGVVPFEVSLNPVSAGFSVALTAALIRGAVNTVKFGIADGGGGSCDGNLLTAETAAGPRRLPGTTAPCFVAAP
ncbi:hypothetical protein [Maliponia aquimaris]|uniref:Uncharacterized protein n=1 Tax=Maliponia aquimaris TaxID=1673631 RepID=A0A238KTX6_9RHOB|nr:hypothetical protein [Maliponia aquimaris]SMX46041.1 hypothetical protein MAA8898_03311 [Maliponia aquimaris]